MLFKKKTLDEKMEKYVKHHDWYAIQEVDYRKQRREDCSSQGTWGKR